MSIAIPDTKKLRMVTANRERDGGVAIPCVALPSAGIGPGPVCVDAGGPHSSGSAYVRQVGYDASGNASPADADADGYLGFNVAYFTPGDAAPSVMRHVTVAGFTGVTPGSPVFLAADGSLTHTVPVVSTVSRYDRKVGVGLSATKIRFA